MLPDIALKPSERTSEDGLYSCAMADVHSLASTLYVSALEAAKQNAALEGFDGDHASLRIAMLQQYPVVANIIIASQRSAQVRARLETFPNPMMVFFGLLFKMIMPAEEPTTQTIINYVTKFVK